MARATDLICDRCGSRKPPVRNKRGYEWTSWALFYGFTATLVLNLVLERAAAEHPNPLPGDTELLRLSSNLVVSFLGAWLLHIVFRRVTAHWVCKDCSNSKTMIPLESPMGQRLAAEFPAATENEESPSRRPARWLRPLAASIPLLAVAGTAVAHQMDPAPRDSCARFARKMVSAQANGDLVFELSKDAEFAETETTRNCIDSARKAREAWGRDGYVRFLDCASQSDSQSALQACTDEIAKDASAQ